MSENLKLVRSICEPWARGDFSSSDWVHPEIEFVIADGPPRGRWIGLGGLIDGFRQVLGAYDDYHTVAEEFRELDSERILKFHHYSGRGKTSGLEIEQMTTAKGADLFDIRCGKVRRLVIYFDRANALADLGLKE